MKNIINLSLDPKNNTSEKKTMSLVSADVDKSAVLRASTVYGATAATAPANVMALWNVDSHCVITRIWLEIMKGQACRIRVGTLDIDQADNEDVLQAAGAGAADADQMRLVFDGDGDANAEAETSFTANSSGMFVPATIGNATELPFRTGSKSRIVGIGLFTDAAAAAEPVAISSLVCRVSMEVIEPTASNGVTLSYVELGEREERGN